MTDIYHITHIDNLPTILSEGGLHCDAAVYGAPIGAIGIAHKALKRRRASRRIPLSPERVVADFVPFYFGPRSPMLFSISLGNVRNYQGGQTPLVYLVSSVEQVISHSLEWVFSDGGAEHQKSGFFNSVTDLDQHIDWGVIRARQWADTQDDTDRVRRRRAEFLVYSFFPWDLVTHLGVIDGIMRTRVSTILDRYAPIHHPRIWIQPRWYYEEHES